MVHQDTAIVGCREINAFPFKMTHEPLSMSETPSPREIPKEDLFIDRINAEKVNGGIGRPPLVRMRRSLVFKVRGSQRVRWPIYGVITKPSRQ